MQNADGDVTEANFGNDDETMGRLEDMGISGVEGVEADLSRQNSGSAQRRRQVGMHYSIYNTLSVKNHTLLIKLVKPP